MLQPRAASECLPAAATEGLHRRPLPRRVPCLTPLSPGVLLWAVGCSCPVHPKPQFGRASVQAGGSHLGAARYTSHEARRSQRREASMRDDVVRAWVDTWSSRYGGFDTQLFGELAGRRELNAEELARIVEWKNKRLWPARKLQDVRAFEDARPSRITEITRLAFSASDPELALHILTLLPGVRSRTASAVLTVHDPTRYTIMDRNALAALRGEPVLGVRRELEDAMMDLPNGDAWWRSLFPAWLRICRKLADRSGRPLRTVDHALMAWGQAAA